MNSCCWTTNVPGGSKGALPKASLAVAQCVAQEGQKAAGCSYLSSSAVPDSIITKALAERLEQQDCIQKGWVLHGFPRDLDQARMLTSMGYNPNR